MATDRTERKYNGLIALLLRFVVNAIVLLVISYIVPGFFVRSFWAAFLAAIVIAVLDYFIEAAFGFDASPFGRGITGFIVAALIIYATQYIVAGVSVSIWGAIIAALIIGIVNLIIPGRLM